jgi:hypothetical protein
MSGPEELAPEPETGTGNPDVDAALGVLDGLDERPPREQVAAYAEAHQALQETLNTIDER